MKDINQLANMLKKSREKSGFTQAEVAKSLGYSTAQFVSNWERGLSYPPLKSLRTLSKMYDVNMDSLFNTILGISIYMTEQSLRREYRSLKKRA